MYEILIISFYYFLTRFYLFEKIYKFVFSKDIGVAKTWVRLSYVPIYGEILAFAAIVGPLLLRLSEIMWNFFFVEDEEEF
jgi:hypothetical protein